MSFILFHSFLESECLCSAGRTGAVIVTPTRELAVQISEVCSQFLFPGPNVQLLVGGKDVEKDVNSINSSGSTVVVATPGRLLVLLSRSDCKLASHVRSLVSCFLNLLECYWNATEISGVSCS